jgi:putative component of membrane protein insertase Oxa1/YidC/SpoIIIJ protein YidD
MKIFFLYIFFFTSLSFAQTDWTRWSAKEVSYELSRQQGENYITNNENFGTTILAGLRDSYGFLFSDLDGDNCPFYPSCSRFFVQSVKETNIFQGTLMFADRFTRDTNIFKRKTHYPVHASGKLYDPVNNYELKSSLVNYIPYYKVVKN